MSYNKLLVTLKEIIIEQGGPGGLRYAVEPTTGKRDIDEPKSVNFTDMTNVTKSPIGTMSSGSENTYILGKKMSIDKNGPTNHASRALGDWQSDNATDIFSPAGTIVYSITKGTVSKVGGEENDNEGKIYGSSVTVKGTDGYPDIFYTHMRNVNVSVGQEVVVGTAIAEISDWVDNPSSTHVHVGLITGRNLSELIDLDTGKAY